MQSDRTWIHRALDRLEACLELQSLGGISWRLTDDELLIVAPVRIEVVGGRDDGSDVFPLFVFDVGAFVEIFDEPPDVRWATGPMPSVSIEGKIDGEAAWIEVQAEPFEDEEPHFTLRPDGSLGKR